MCLSYPGGESQCFLDTHFASYKGIFSTVSGESCSSGEVEKSIYLYPFIFFGWAFSLWHEERCHSLIITVIRTQVAYFHCAYKVKGGTYSPLHALA